MSDITDRYDELLGRKGGDYGEAFGAVGRGTSTDPDTVNLERYAQGAADPITALVSPVYEGAKGIEQNTGVPALSTLVDLFHLPQDWKPGVGTSPASAEHVLWAARGAGRRLGDVFRGAASRLFNRQ